LVSGLNPFDFHINFPPIPPLFNEKLFLDLRTNLSPFFCQHTIHQVIWPSSGTLSRWDWLHVHTCPNLESSSKSSSKLSEYHCVLTTSSRKKVNHVRSNHILSYPTHKCYNERTVVRLCKRTVRWGVQVQGRGSERGGGWVCPHVKKFQL